VIRLWLAKHQAGEFSEEAAVADSMEEYEARIAALERKVGQLTLENELLKRRCRAPFVASDGSFKSVADAVPSP
jgi:transposase